MPSLPTSPPWEDVVTIGRIGSLQVRSGFWEMLLAGILKVLEKVIDVTSMGRKEFISPVRFADEAILNEKLHYCFFFFSLHSDQNEPQYENHFLL